MKEKQEANQHSPEKRPQVVIVGAGFGGLQTARALANSAVDVHLIDKNNHHLFQPLLYQVATAALSPADIAAPVRTIFRDAKNVNVEMDEVIAIDVEKSVVHRRIEGSLAYDYLVLAPGTRHSYFGHPEWEEYAPGLKSLDDALDIRRKILVAYEQAEHHLSQPGHEQCTTFIVVGGGPTGVELAGALAEIGSHTMLRDFPMLNPSDIRVILVEAGERILPSFDERLSLKAQKHLQDLGVEVRTSARVENISEEGVTINSEYIQTCNVIWAAGNAAPSWLAGINTPLDKAGRVIVQHDCSLPAYPKVFVIGDAAHFSNKKDVPLPGVAQVAMQQGRYVATLIKKKIPQDLRPPFRYVDKGNMATIGRAKAVAELAGGIRLWGFVAWALWAMIHVVSLIRFRNRFSVMMEWLWYYISYQPGARLIIEERHNNA